MGGEARPHGAADPVVSATVYVRYRTQTRRKAQVPLMRPLSVAKLLR